MAGLLTDEPQPRVWPTSWSASHPPTGEVLALDPPFDGPERSFPEVMQARQSRLGGTPGWQSIGELLWFAAASRQSLGIGRAGIPIEHRWPPSAGGLHAIEIVCLMATPQECGPRLYLPDQHALALLAAGGAAEACRENARIVGAMLGIGTGCTLRLIADFSKVAAAYTNPESLVWRDAGVLVATLAYVAEWLGLRTRPLGLVGTGLLSMLGYPQDRYMAVGGIQVFAATDAV